MTIKTGQGKIGMGKLWDKWMMPRKRILYDKFNSQDLLFWSSGYTIIIQFIKNYLKPH